ncbi:MAG: transglycosylase SLT domain-containing protein [Paludibacteraceae bacterium]|nr:transglycosylase SLT domain-containing protein [Paludibacteraceae bacterium]
MEGTVLTDTLPLLTNDSSTNDSINKLPIDTISYQWFDLALAWLDTTECTSNGVIYELPDSVYKARLKELPFTIEVPYNQVVRNYINRYIKGYKRLAALNRKAEYYFPIFEDILCQYDLPYELCYMAVIESALNPSARSKMGAAGIWQFMPSTGKIYGLEINSLVDERMDPIKSTEAACKYLKTLYNIFEDWNLAIAAYNCGSGNVNKAIHRAGKKDFWSIYPYLPQETRSYLPIFIAAAYAMNYAEDHGICPASLDISMRTDTIQTKERVHLEQISAVLDIPLDELRRLNPQYTRNLIPGGEKNYTLCLPIEKAGLYIDHKDTIMAHRADELVNNRREEVTMTPKSVSSGKVTIYTIKSGDTLSAIAKKFHVSVKQIKQWNGMKSDNIRAGRTLRIGG